MIFFKKLIFFFFFFFYFNSHPTPRVVDSPSRSSSVEPGSSRETPTPPIPPSPVGPFTPSVSSNSGSDPGVDVNL